MRIVKNNSQVFLINYDHLAANRSALGQSVEFIRYNPPGNQSAEPLPITSGLQAMDFDMDGRSDLLMLDAGCLGVVENEPTSGSLSTRTRPRGIIAPVGGGAIGTVSLDQVPLGNFEPSGLPRTCGRGYGRTIVLDSNRDGLLDFIQSEGVGEDERLVLYTRDGQKPDLLMQVTDGLGNATLITYGSAKNPSIHTPATDCVYPQSCGRPDQTVVAMVARNYGDQGDDWDNLIQQEHTYSGYRRDLLQGSLGFDSHSVEDKNTKVIVTNTFDHTLKYGTTIYPLLGRPSQHYESYPMGKGDKYLDKTNADRFAAK